MLQLLLQSCSTCSANATIEKLAPKSSAILVHLKCVREHINLWRSQPLIRNYYQGNIRMAASVLFSSNTFEKMKTYFELAAIPFVSKSSFYRIQGKYLFGVANKAWLNEQGGILNAIKKEKSCCLSGDGRSDNPGHNAKYFTYSFLNQSSNKFAGLVVT